MARSNVRLDFRGIGAVMKSVEMHREIQDRAEEIAGYVESLGIRVGDHDGGPHEAALPVEVDMTTTDRAHGRVTLAHASGEAVQAKHGALTKAAARAGLDFKAKR